MRIWDFPPEILCRQHLLGEHRELHAIWNIITKGMKGYSQHPETKRWIGKLRILYKRHQLLVEEMDKRGYNHKSPLDKQKASGKGFQDTHIDSTNQQKTILKKKNCNCKI